MSDKYTIEQFEYRADTIAVVEFKTNAIICESTSIDDARIICKLLNENEARKNQPMIDKNLKDLIIQNIKACTYFEKYAIHKMTLEQCKKAITTIENLPTEEN